MTRSRQDKGFSLVEMLVVLALIALTLTLSLPYSQSSGLHRRLSAEAQMVAARLRETRSLALSSRQPQYLVIDVEHRAIRGPGHQPNIVLEAVQNVILTTADDLIVDRQGAIGFFPDGRATGGAITLERDKAKRIVSVNWLTGSIAVSVGEGRDGM